MVPHGFKILFELIMYTHTHTHTHIHKITLYTRSYKENNKIKYKSYINKNKSYTVYISRIIRDRRLN